MSMQWMKMDQHMRLSAPVREQITVVQSRKSDHSGCGRDHSANRVATLKLTGICPGSRNRRRFARDSAQPGHGQEGHSGRREAD